MRLYSLYIILVLPALAFGQSSNSRDKLVNQSGAIKVKFANNPKEASELANLDIKQGTTFILLKNTFSPVVYNTDKKFERKYNTRYLESGCTGPAEELAAEYNKTVFQLSQCKLRNTFVKIVLF